MDQGHDRRLVGALDDNKGWVKALEGYGAVAIQVQRAGDDHDVVKVGATACLTLIMYLIQGFSFWKEREDSTNVNLFLGFYPLHSHLGPCLEGM